MFPDDAFEPTLLGAARKHWRLVVAFALGGLVAAWLIHSAVAGDWIARASMLVEDPESSQLFDQESQGSPERYTGDQVATLESTPVATRALEIAEESTEGGSFSIGEFTDGVEVQSTLESGLIEILASNEDPDKAVVIANAIVTAYQETKEEQTVRRFESAIAEFDDSIADVDTELDEISTQIAELRSGEGGDVDGQLQTAIAQLLELLNQPAAQATPQVEAVLQQLQTLQLIRSVQAEDPELASLTESRNQALERRSQLALRRDQLRVDAALTSTGIVLVSPAQEADQAIGLPRALVFGLLLGAVLGAVAALAMATRSHRFNHRSEPELLVNAPLLADVPHFAEEGLDTDLPSIDAPDSASAEALRFAVAGLGGGAPDGRGEPAVEGAGDVQGVVAVASPSLRDGKSVLAANLAATAVQLGSRVLLVDCDFGDPSLARLFGAPTDTVGLTDVVDDGLDLEAAVTRVRIDEASSLDLLTRGSRNVTAPHFFRSPAATEFFTDLRNRYDLVIVDTPPMLQVAYSGTVLALCDRVVLVVPHRGEVSRLAEAAERLYLAGSRADGYIYNRAPLRREAWADDRLRTVRSLAGTVRTTRDDD